MNENLLQKITALGPELRERVTRDPERRRRPNRSIVPIVILLIQSAQDHRRSVNAPHLVAPVRAGAVFSNCVLIERPEQAAA